MHRVMYIFRQCILECITLIYLTNISKNALYRLDTLYLSTLYIYVMVIFSFLYIYMVRAMYGPYYVQESCVLFLLCYVRFSLRIKICWPLTYSTESNHWLCNYRYLLRELLLCLRVFQPDNWIIHRRRSKNTRQSYISSILFFMWNITSYRQKIIYIDHTVEERGNSRNLYPEQFYLFNSDILNLHSSHTMLHVHSWNGIRLFLYEIPSVGLK